MTRTPSAHIEQNLLQFSGGVPQERCNGRRTGHRVPLAATQVSRLLPSCDRGHTCLNRVEIGRLGVKPESIGALEIIGALVVLVAYMGAFPAGCREVTSLSRCTEN